ncbi:MAG: hypothetical protein KF782_01100 [Labilithrix sp.]|nr:hypothetical protein [Labilithrix sp.]
MLRHAYSRFSFGAVLLVVVPACSAAGADAAAGDSSDLTGPIELEALDVVRQDAAAGLAVLKSKAEYEAFFGASPPASVDFRAHWVIHYATGNKTSGGHRAEITSVQKQRGETPTLVVYATDSSPGAGCLAPAVSTNPQTTIRINKQPGIAQARLEEKSVVADCADDSPKSCGEIDGECVTSTSGDVNDFTCFDVGLSWVLDASCPSSSQACCVPFSPE